MLNQQEILARVLAIESNVVWSPNAFDYTSPPIQQLNQPVDGDYPWKGSDIGDGTIRIQKGRWTRNPDLRNTALTLDCGANEYVDTIPEANEYIIAVLARDDVDKDPRLYPTAVFLGLFSYADKDSVVEELGGSVYYGGHVVIGKMTAGVWEQWWTGGDITDALEINDGDSTDTSSPIVRTLERNPAAAHLGENQLVNADAATVDNYNVPYLPKDAEGAGDLTWARIDTHYSAGASKSVEVSSGNLQVRGWATAAETAQATGDLILAQRVVSGARDAVYLDVDDLPYLPDDTVLPTVPSTDKPWPTAHNHVDLGLLDADDHVQYVILRGNLGREANNGTVDLEGAIYVVTGPVRVNAGNVETEDGHVKVLNGAYYHNNLPGLGVGSPAIREWDDVNGKHHTVTISGGIITAWAIG